MSLWCLCVSVQSMFNTSESLQRTKVSKWIGWFSASKGSFYPDSSQDANRKGSEANWGEFWSASTRRRQKENAMWASARRPSQVSVISHQSCDPGGSEFDEGSSFVSAVEGVNRYVSSRNEFKALSYFRSACQWQSGGSTREITFT